MPEAEAPCWYAIRVQSNKEEQVKRTLLRKIETHGLQDKIKDVAVPVRKFEEIKNGRKRVRSEKIYPGYVLVQMVLDDQAWLFIRETAGVGDFVGSHAGSNKKPYPLTDGPFEDFDGVVEEIMPEKGRIRVTVNIFGRAAPVELEYWQAEKI